MDEEAIAARLRENIPKPSEAVKPPAVISAQPGTSADYSGDFQLDETTLYKLHEFLGEKYSPYNKDQIKYANYIYAELSHYTHSKEYADIIGSAAQIMRQMGISMSDRRMYKLYQWLKLDSVRRRVELEMGAIHA
jgi:hypothetical protein